MNKICNTKRTFLKLIDACHEQDAYSVPMMCTKAGIDYKQIKKWAHADNRWAHALAICHSLCKGNAEMAALMNRMPLKEMLPFIKASNKIVK